MWNGYILYEAATNLNDLLGRGKRLFKIVLGFINAIMLQRYICI